MNDFGRGAGWAHNSKKAPALNGRALQTDTERRGGGRGSLSIYAGGGASRREGRGHITRRSARANFSKTGARRKGRLDRGEGHVPASKGRLAVYETVCVKVSQVLF